jgi:hypothetical protein
VAILHRVRHRGLGAVLLGLVALAAGCDRREEPEPSLLPDSALKVELGLTDADVVYRITIAGGPRESLDPAQVELPSGAWLEFVSGDWRVHEVRFEADSLSGPPLEFLHDTDQMESPPLVNRDARYVVSFAGAPEARYPFVVEGNGKPACGVVVVRSRR